MLIHLPRKLVHSFYPFPKGGLWPTKYLSHILKSWVLSQSSRAEGLESAPGWDSRPNTGCFLSLPCLAFQEMQINILNSPSPSSHPRPCLKHFTTSHSGCKLSFWALLLTRSTLHSWFQVSMVHTVQAANNQSLAVSQRAQVLKEKKLGRKPQLRLTFRI